ncbi:hypothetical protein EDB86DRAFT_1287441 [Lactarius hatsudake]|nr:hypothetical protein EDB86DRAFT_1287441 [Lactarius hatsudake]
MIIHIQSNASTSTPPGRVQYTRPRSSLLYAISVVPLSWIQILARFGFLRSGEFRCLAVRAFDMGVCSPGVSSRKVSEISVRLTNEESEDPAFRPAWYAVLSCYAVPSPLISIFQYQKFQIPSCCGDISYSTHHHAGDVPCIGILACRPGNFLSAPFSFGSSPLLVFRLLLMITVYGVNNMYSIGISRVGHGAWYMAR